MSSRSRDQDTSQDSTRPSSRPSSPRRSPSRAVQPPRRTTPGTRSVTSPITRPPISRHASYNPLDLPPLPRASAPAEDPFTQPSVRQPSFSSILNPQQHAEERSSSRRRKASEIESPQLSPTQQLPPILARGPQRQTTPSLSAPSPILQQGDFSERTGRRILTPRSPSLHRAASLGQLNPSTGTISAQRAPFPPSPRHRTYAIEPGTGDAPPRPAMSSIIQTPSAPFIQHQPRSLGHRASVDLSGSRNVSASASPSTSYSSYSQASNTSPGEQYVHGQSSIGPPHYGRPGDPISGEASLSGSYPGPAGTEFQRPMGIPISSSGGQNVYQMMTLETTSGTVQVPVDVQAASRVADEKRRRNAGASARFRQRRKEKEKEASTTISRLEQQVKDISEDAEFYRRERDYLAGALSRTHGAERHFPRPPSPRGRRSSAISLPGPSGLGSAAFPAQDQIPRSPDQGRNVRRRTSTMSFPQPPSQPQMAAPGTPIAYARQPYGTPLAPPPPHAASQRVQPPPNPPVPGGPLPSPSEITGRPPPQQLPGLPQVLHPMPQWSPYQSGPPPPPDPNQRPGQP
jgi:hypothetical protein